MRSNVRERESPAQDDRGQKSQSTDSARECGVNNMRNGTVFSNYENTFVSIVDFGNIADFTTLFIVDILHDYFKTDDIVVIDERDLIRLYDIVAFGIHSSMVNAPYTYQDLLNNIGHAANYIINNLEGLTIETISSADPNNPTVKIYKIPRFEVAVSNIYSNGKVFTQRFRKIPISLERSPIKLSADACRTGDATRTPCKEYTEFQKSKKTIVTLATKIDAGFMKEHVDYYYCEQEFDYILANFRLDMRLLGIGPNANYYLFSKVNYDNTVRDGPSLYYYTLPDINRAPRLEHELYRKKEFYRQRFDRLHTQPADPQTKRRRAKQMFELFMNKFYGDFIQILYIHAVNNNNTSLKFNAPSGLHILTRDILMSVISVVMLGIPILTSIDGQITKLAPINAPVSRIEVIAIKLPAVE